MRSKWYKMGYSFSKRAIRLWVIRNWFRSFSRRTRRFNKIFSSGTRRPLLDSLKCLNFASSVSILMKKHGRRQHWKKLEAKPMQRKRKLPFPRMERGKPLWRNLQRNKTRKSQKYLCQISKRSAITWNLINWILRTPKILRGFLKKKTKHPILLLRLVLQENSIEVFFYRDWLGDPIFHNLIISSNQVQLRISWVNIWKIVSAWSDKAALNNWLCSSSSRTELQIFALIYWMAW